MNIQLQVLTALNLTEGFLVPEGSVYNAVVLAETRPPTRSEVGAALRTLEAAGEVVGVSNADTGTKWQIADKGRARVMNAGL